LLDALAVRIREYAERARRERGDVVMGCVRLETRAGWVGIVYDKPGGSSAQFEASHDPERGFVMLSPEGKLVVEPDPEQVYARFVAVIDSIPEQRRLAIEQKLAEWRSQGYTGPRLRAMVMAFNSTYDGTRGGEMAPEELRHAARLAAS
jgi:hypothetical protein